MYIDIFDVLRIVQAPLDGTQGLDDVKNMIHKLYTSLNIDQHQLGKKRELEGQVEELKADLEPLEREFEEIMKKSSSQTNKLLWLGRSYDSSILIHMN